MTEKFKIERILESNVDDGMGGTQATQWVRLSVYHAMGRGVVLSVQSFAASRGFESTNLFGADQAYLTVERMARLKTTAVAAYGKNLIDNGDGILAMLDDWHKDAAWTKEARADVIAAALLLVRTPKIDMVHMAEIHRVMGRRVA